MTYLGDPQKRKPKNPDSELDRLIHDSVTKVKRNKKGRKRQTPRFTV